MIETCPKCKKKDIERETKSEYTGGGFADYWDEYYCKHCEYEWRGDKKSDYS